MLRSGGGRRQTANATSALCVRIRELAAEVLVLFVRGVGGSAVAAIPRWVIQSPGKPPVARRATRAVAVVPGSWSSAK